MNDRIPSPKQIITQIELGKHRETEEARQTRKSGGPLILSDETPGPKKANSLDTLRIETVYHVTIGEGNNKRRVSAILDKGCGKRGLGFPRVMMKNYLGFDAKEEAEAALDKMKDYIIDLEAKKK